MCVWLLLLWWRWWWEREREKKIFSSLSLSRFIHWFIYGFFFSFLIMKKKFSFVRSFVTLWIWWELIQMKKRRKKEELDLREYFYSLIFQFIFFEFRFFFLVSSIHNLSVWRLLCVCVYVCPKEHHLFFIIIIIRWNI